MISKFAIACVAVIFAGGAAASLGSENPASSPLAAAPIARATPISAIADPQTSFKDVSVQLVSGKPVGRVVDIAVNEAGRATRVRVELADMPSEAIWLDQSDLGYSRSRDIIVAYDVHAPNMAVADAR